MYECYSSAAVLVVNLVIVFTVNRSFYPTTSAVPRVSLLVLHPREIGILRSLTETHRKNQSRELIKVRGKSSANVPGTRAQQKRHPRNNYEKKSISYAINVLGYPGPNIRR